LCNIVPKRSAGLLLYRTDSGVVEVLIAHMGGPFWARKNAGAWSIPKGEYGDDEDPLAAATREFGEELGVAPPDGTPVDLGAVRQSGGKVVTAYALEGDVDLSAFHSNTFLIEWPRNSGRQREFPEVDRVEWVDLDTAATLLVKGQVPFLDALRRHVASP
jgi:predicted NUDIX family NTP pyrophosphohydrolase